MNTSSTPISQSCRTAQQLVYCRQRTTRTRRDQLLLPGHKCLVVGRHLPVVPLGEAQAQLSQDQHVFFADRGLHGLVIGIPRRDRLDISLKAPGNQARPSPHLPYLPESLHGLPKGAAGIPVSCAVHRLSPVSPCVE